MELTINSGDLQDALEAIDISGRDKAVMALNEDNWIIKSSDPANVLMAAVLVPKSAMGTYNPGGYESVGLPVGRMDDFIEGRSDLITMRMEERALHVDDGNTHARLATVNPDAVEGHMPSVPNIEYEVTFTSSVDLIKNFVRKADNVLNTSFYFISARESGLYLYTEGDNGQIDRYNSWDDFDNYEIDWSVGNDGPTGSLDPETHKGTDCIMSTDFTSDIKKIDDDSVISIGNHIPLRVLYDKSGNSSGGMKISLMQTPRIDQSGENRIPERIIEKYS